MQPQLATCSQQKKGLLFSGCVGGISVGPQNAPEFSSRFPEHGFKCAVKPLNCTITLRVIRCGVEFGDP